MYKYVLAVLVTGTILVVNAVCWVAWSNQQTLRNFEIGQDHTLRVWVEDDWTFWVPGLFYQIFHEGREVVPKTFVGTVRAHENQEFDLSLVINRHDELAGVYGVDRATGEPKFTIVFDFATGDSWPRDRDKALNWCERFRKLHAADPRFPVPKRTCGD